MDVSITQWINSLGGHSAIVDGIMIAATHFGVPVIIAFVALQWWSRTDRYHVRHAALSAGLAFIFGLLINQAILLFVHRVRPYDAGLTHLMIEHSGDWSFPSDHATASFSVAVAFLLNRLPKRALALLAMAGLVCFSRIYVGTHYVSDILGGAATGVVAAFAVHFAYREDNPLDRFATRIL